MAASSAVAPRASASRELSGVETTWCSLLDGGTGLIISALWFARPLSRSSVQAAASELINQLPYLNSQVRCGEKNKLFVELRRNGPAVLEELNPFINEGAPEAAEPKEVWLKIVDLETNRLFPSTKTEGCSPIFQIVLYKNLPKNSTLVVLRFQHSTFDMPCLSPILSSFLKILRQSVEREESGQRNEELLQNLTLKDETLAKYSYYPSMDAIVPKGAAEKSILSFGVDMVGYGVAASKQRYIPFNDVKAARQSRLIRASLPRETTDRLIQACKRNSSDLYGASTAAVLKAIADYKRLGKNKEHYGVATFFNCRSQLNPPLPEEALGFYSSAMLVLSQVSESVKGSSPFWKVATDATKSFNEAVKQKKHFRDMKDLNMLTATAVKHPGVTPEGTLRTVTISILHDPVDLKIPKDAAEYLQLRDHVEFSSCHGVGPCVAVCNFLTDGALDFTFVYPSPLFSRVQMQTLIDNAMKYLTDST